MQAVAGLILWFPLSIDPLAYFQGFPQENLGIVLHHGLNLVKNKYYTSTMMGRANPNIPPRVSLCVALGLESMIIVIEETGSSVRRPEAFCVLFVFVM